MWLLRCPQLHWLPACNGCAWCSHLPPTEELSKAIDVLSSEKPQAVTAYHQRVIKCGKSALLKNCSVSVGRKAPFPKTCAMQPSLPCWKTRATAVIVTITGAFHCSALLGKSLPASCSLAARIYPESQYRFRAGRSTIDMIFTVRQIQKCREQGKHLYLAFIDLTKAFNLVSRNGLFQLLEKIGCPPNSAAWSSPSAKTWRV